MLVQIHGQERLQVTKESLHLLLSSLIEDASGLFSPAVHEKQVIAGVSIRTVFVDLTLTF